MDDIERFRRIFHEEIFDHLFCLGFAVNIFLIKNGKVDVRTEVRGQLFGITAPDGVGYFIIDIQGKGLCANSQEE